MTNIAINRRSFVVGAASMTAALAAGCSGSGGAAVVDSSGSSTSPTSAMVGSPETAQRSDSPTLVLIHGAWHRPLPTWHLVQPLLTAAGFQSAAVSLPSAGPIGQARPGLTDDVATVNAVIDQIDGPVILVGHSYGGVVASAAGHHPAVRSLVYLAAFALAEGETVLDIAATVTPPPPIATAIDFRADDLMTIDAAQARDVFYLDVPDALAADSIAALVPSTSAIFLTKQSRPAWLDKPSLYVICNQDRAIPVIREREMSRHCTSTIELTSSHSPFLSMPDRVASLLIDHSQTLA